uniref:TDP-glucose 4,6-dehydratase n=1 Tax=Astyanax mexicanus TaxID=7994 RepID=A0A8B9JNR4_ASTMX
MSEREEKLELDCRKTVLVTGGAGFIGSHLIILLAARYPLWRIINIDSLQYCSSLKNLECLKNTSTYKFIQGDICDQYFTNHLFSTENIDIVFHCAAQSHVDNSFLYPSQFMHVNAEGTHVVLRAAFEAGVERFIYVSTDEVYGDSLDKEFDELSYSKIFGTGLQSRHFLHVDDVTDALLILMEQGVLGEIYNIGANFEIPIIHLARELVQLVKNASTDDLDNWLLFVEDRPVSDLRYPMISDKMHKLGWKPKVPWKEGIRRTIKWYEENAGYWPVVTEKKHQGAPLTVTHHSLHSETAKNTFSKSFLSTKL